MEEASNSDIGKIKLKKHPASKANFLSRYFFLWTFPIFLNGYRRELQEDDLFPPLQEHTSKILGDNLEELWQKHPSLWCCFLKLFGTEFVINSVLILIQEILTFGVYPFILKELLDHYYKQKQRSRCYLTASSIILIAILRVLIYRWHRFSLTILGMKMRIACSSLIYRKILQLRKVTLQNITVGHLITLLSNDTYRLDQAMLYLPYLLFAPVLVIFVTCSLYNTVGLQGTAGLGIFIISLIFTSSLSHQLVLSRKEVASQTDYRIRLVNDVITGIKAIKMHTWEKPFITLIKQARKLEILKIRKANLLRITFSMLKMCISETSLFVSISTAVVTATPLTPQYVFVVYSQFEGLTILILVYFVKALINFNELQVSFKRIENFLLTKMEKNKLIEKTEKTRPRIEANNISVKWASDSPETLIDVTFSVQPGELVAIAGASGSGKSSLLQTILGENILTKGSLRVEGTVSYASQEPWIFSASVKQNILFGQTMIKEKYLKVLKICALEHDLSLFPYGDNSLVGERGLILSGGQRARINLARAIYKDADIYLLDDPLSALDSHVGKQIYNECILDYLKAKAVVLVTHRLNFLKDITRIYLLENGKVTSNGNFEKLNLEKTFHEKNDLIDRALIEKQNLPKQTKEHRSFGSGSKKVYVKFYRASGRYLTICIISFILIQFLKNTTEYYVTFWVNLEQKAIQVNPVFEKFLTTYNCLYIHLSIWLLGLLTAIATAFFFIKFCMTASRKLHDKMLKTVIYQHITFFNTHSSGTILNRFSNDIGIIDESIPFIIFEVLTSLPLVLGLSVITCILNYWMLISTIPLLVLFYCFFHIFNPTNKSMKRTEGVTRSPMFAHVTATLQGLTTIRAFNNESLLIEEYDHHQDLNTSAFYLIRALNSSLIFCIDCICAIYTGCIIYSFLLLRENASVANLGLAVTQAVLWVSNFQFAIKMFVELDTQMVAAERISDYSELHPEPDDSKEVPEKWPGKGSVSFQSVSLKYSPEAPLVLKQISFHVCSGEKIGIVGKTGAGKTSLLSVLFRLYDFEGQIFIDGVDTKSVPLRSLRSKIAVIPQEPVLFLGSIRKNLDPFDRYTDAKLWTVLEELELKEMVDSLETVVLEGGSNFSVGQRQLLCLVRAVLSCAKIIVLDEATANVDLKTDQIIQKAIKKKFEKCTVWTIAHRIDTVMNSDKILVMDEGRVMEFDSPSKLLKNTNGYFSSYVKKSCL